MKTYTIKNYAGQKTLIVNDLKNSNIQDLFKVARKMKIPFAIKKEIGIQIWGAFTVAEYCGIADVSKLLN